MAFGTSRETWSVGENHLDEDDCGTSDTDLGRDKVDWMTNDSGVSPFQAVTGRNSALAGFLMVQLQSGKIRFKMNQELQRDEALRPAERIRAAAIEACD